MPFQHYKQLDAMDCGPTCLRMVAKHHGKNFSLQTLREKAQIDREGVSLLGISEAAESVGFRTLAVKITLQQLLDEAPLPCIVHWNQNHFVVVHAVKKTKSGIVVHVADPAASLITYTAQEFESRWASTASDGEKAGIVLLLETTPNFYEEPDEKSKGLGLNMLFSYVFRYKNLITQLILGLLIGSVLQLILPFLTQSIVDTGIQTRNLHFIYLILAAQMMLFMGKVSVEFIRSWIILHISSRINLSILSDFLTKLLKLPVSFFDSKMTGDIMQRIGDHQRIETFLTGTSLNVLFSMFNIVVFSVVLAYYNLKVFTVFVIGSVLYAVWIMLFLKYRRKLDHKRFALASQNQSSLIQLVQSVPELKLNNSEIKKRWDWENLQVREFKLSVQGLAVQQYQQAGGLFLNEGKNIFISFLAATAVVKGEMTLGAMMALQYIIGQLNSPVEQLIQFIQHWQDAQISLERLNEIHEQSDEEPEDKPFVSTLSQNQDITFRNITFAYPGAGNNAVLKNIFLKIPQGKITAIVGGSGSGKTTLIKLLLKFYTPQEGEIKVGNNNLENISHRFWRSKCGTVMQDGFIFSDTIANNIGISDETVNPERLLYATEMANIQDFIDDLPLNYNTKIGAEGNGISQGQRQRILIARAIYKNPDFIFFDEATNALDANNESIILRNLDDFFKGEEARKKTVIVVAHRLSTVKNADQIVVMEKGEIVELGNHQELTALRGKYYELVKNQLELGN